MSTDEWNHNNIDSRDELIQNQKPPCAPTLKDTPKKKSAHFTTEVHPVSDQASERGGHFTRLSALV